MQDDCIFCQILEGELPAYKVYEDDGTFAFMDIFPVGVGHVLVITREHHENVFETPTQSLSDVSSTVKKVAHALKQLYAPAGLTIAQLNGGAAGQTVFHYHTHLIPRMEGDSMDIHSRTQGDPEQLASAADALARLLARS